MDTELDIKKIESIIEATLFAKGTKVSIDNIAKVIEKDKKDTKDIMNNMIYRYNSTSRGIMIIEIDGGYQLATRPEYHDNIKKIHESEKKTTLSQAALETLAIIAYNAPITKSKIESIRGVNSDGAIIKLMSRNLVKEAGRLEAPGKPFLFETTDDFLRSFGIKSKADLPVLSMNNITDDK